MREALAALDTPAREAIARAVARRAALGDERPIQCPLLDEERGLCRIESRAQFL